MTDNMISFNHNGIYYINFDIGDAETHAYLADAVGKDNLISHIELHRIKLSAPTETQLLGQYITDLDLKIMMLEETANV